MPWRAGIEEPQTTGWGGLGKTRTLRCCVPTAFLRLLLSQRQKSEVAEQRRRTAGEARVLIVTRAETKRRKPTKQVEETMLLLFLEGRNRGNWIAGVPVRVI